MFSECPLNLDYLIHYVPFLLLSQLWFFQLLLNHLLLLFAFFLLRCLGIWLAYSYKQWSAFSSFFWLHKWVMRINGVDASHFLFAHWWTNWNPDTAFFMLLFWPTCWFVVWKWWFNNMTVGSLNGFLILRTYQSHLLLCHTLRYL